MVIAIDFDGTCVTHDFPRVGEDIGAAPVLRELVAAGHQLILFTMRSDIENPTGDDPDLHLEPGNYLTDALEWFERNSIPLYGVQTNPTQSSWTTSPKAYAQLYIDDAALGCPLHVRPWISERPFVDWRAVRLMLAHRGLLSTGEYCSCFLGCLSSQPYGAKNREDESTNNTRRKPNSNGSVLERWSRRV